MNSDAYLEILTQPAPDTLPFRYYEDLILTEARDRIYELLDQKRTADAQAMAQEWSL